MVIDLDKNLRHLGNPGCYHILLFVCLSSNNVVVLLNHLAMSVYGSPVPYHCRLPGNYSLNDSVPWVTDKAGNLKPDSCRVYQNFTSSTNLTEQCPDGWEYETDNDRHRTLVMEVNQSSVKPLTVLTSSMIKGKVSV